MGLGGGEWGVLLLLREWRWGSGSGSGNREAVEMGWDGWWCIGMGVLGIDWGALGAGYLIP